MNEYFQVNYTKTGAKIAGRFGVTGPLQTLQQFDFGDAREVVEAMKAELDECLTEIEEEAERQEQAAREEATADLNFRRKMARKAVA